MDCALVVVVCVWSESVKSTVGRNLLVTGIAGKLILVGIKFGARVQNFHCKHIIKFGSLVQDYHTHICEEEILI